MTTQSYTVERYTKVWDDQHGCHISVGPDRDALDLVEIRYIDDQGKDIASFAIPKEMAKLLGKAITNTVEGEMSWTSTPPTT
jgi:hypothetical protein